MKLIKFFSSLLFITALIVLLNGTWFTSSAPIPTFGKLLNPFTGFWQNAESTEGATFANLTHEKLKAPVEVAFDSLMVPHIFAKNNHDLFFAQGYITAQHRLWQMEMQTYAAAGRLSEIVGPSTLPMDRLTRRLGLKQAAEASTKNMMANPEMAEVLNAYADGINAFINSLDYASLPLEYKLLDFEPEPWSPLKSGFLLMSMANTLTGHEYDLENTNTLKFLGKELFDYYFPDYPKGIDPVIPSETEWGFTVEVAKQPDTAYYQHFIPETIPMPDPTYGSNNWAVGAAKTKNGRPILANDPHLQLNLPSLWYMAQLQGGETNVMGASLPGSPGIIIGFTDSIAWGVTNGTQDVRDWYNIHFKDQSRLEYQYNGEWHKTQIIREEFKIRGEESFIDSIYVTHHGPVVYDHNFPSESNDPLRGFALRWTVHEPGEELLTFLKLGRAKNHADYASALQHYRVPGQNFVFASAQGDIAIWQQGLFPKRFPEQGKFLMDGRDPDLYWNEFIPTSQNPQVLNPERGFVSSANQIAADEKYPHYIMDNGFEDYRNRRINTLLSSMDSITIQEMMALQQDNYSLKAAETLPAMLDSLDQTQFSTEQQKAFDLLATWDYEYNEGSMAPVLYDMWWDSLMALTWDEFFVDSIAFRIPDSYRTSQLFHTAPNDTLFDVVSTKERRETVVDLYRMSFAGAATKYYELQEQQATDWGHYKATSIVHLSQQPAFSELDVYSGGSRSIVNATTKRTGPSWRMVVELGDQPRAYGVYPGGQSGNPGSPYYTNLLEYWRTGQYYPLQLATDANSVVSPLMVQQLTPLQ